MAGGCRAHLRESRMASIISSAMGCAPMACRMIALPRKKACVCAKYSQSLDMLMAGPASCEVAHYDVLRAEHSVHISSRPDQVLA